MKNTRLQINFNPGSSKERFMEKLSQIEYAIFDFDGTLYPGLFLFDLTKKIFEEKFSELKYQKKMEQLENVAKIYKAGDFITSQSKFLDLLRDEDKKEFEYQSRNLLKNAYSYAKPTIGELKNKYGVKSYLISLTADFVAKIIKKQFNFEEVFSIKYKYTKTDLGEKFGGEVFDTIENPQEIKRRMFLDFQNLNLYKDKSNFIAFFDSLDDLPIASSAFLKVGVNLNDKLSMSDNVDLILTDKNGDPWRDFYQFLLDV